MALLNLGQDFTPDDSTQPSMPDIEAGKEEVKEAPAEEIGEEEKETPAEPPAEEKPAEELQKQPLSDDTGTVKQVEGLLREKEKLLAEIQSLRGDRRQLKQEELAKVEQKIGKVNPLDYPDDSSYIDALLKEKGVMTQQEVNSMFYKSVEQDEVRKFLEKYPEYKPENDKDDINWGAVERHFRKWYRKPENPREIGDVLEKIHQDISKPSSDRTLEARRQQVKTAGVGGGGTQRSSSQKTFDSDKRAMLLRGGWTEEEIKKMESQLEG